MFSLFIVDCHSDNGRCKIYDMDYGVRFINCHPTDEGGSYANDTICMKCCPGFECVVDKDNSDDMCEYFICKQKEDEYEGDDEESE